MGNYKVEEKQFNKIKDRIEKYKSIGHICKNVRCIETGQIFENARKASEWVSFIKEYGDVALKRRTDPDFVEDGSVEFRRRIVEIAVWEALQEDVVFPFAQELELAWME